MAASARDHMDRLFRALPDLEGLIVAAGPDGLSFLQEQGISTPSDVFMSVTKWSRNGCVNSPPWIVGARYADLYGWCKQVANNRIRFRAFENGEWLTGPILVSGVNWVGALTIVGQPDGWQYIGANDAQWEHLRVTIEATSVAQIIECIAEERGEARVQVPGVFAVYRRDAFNWCKERAWGIHLHLEDAARDEYIVIGGEKPYQWVGIKTSADTAASSGSNRTRPTIAPPEPARDFWDEHYRASGTTNSIPSVSEMQWPLPVAAVSPTLQPGSIPVERMPPLPPKMSPLPPGPPPAPPVERMPPLPPVPPPAPPGAPSPASPAASPDSEVSMRIEPVAKAPPGEVAKGKDKDWCTLTPAEQEAAQQIGYDPTSWDEGREPQTCKIRWNELIPQEQLSAKVSECTSVSAFPAGTSRAKGALSLLLPASLSHAFLCPVRTQVLGYNSTDWDVEIECSLQELRLEETSDSDDLLAAQVFATISSLVIDASMLLSRLGLEIAAQHPGAAQMIRRHGGLNKWIERELQRRGKTDEYELFRAQPLQLASASIRRKQASLPPPSPPQSPRPQPTRPNTGGIQMHVAAILEQYHEMELQVESAHHAEEEAAHEAEEARANLRAVETSSLELEATNCKLMSELSEAKQLILTLVGPDDSEDHVKAFKEIPTSEIEAMLTYVSRAELRLHECLKMRREEEKQASRRRTECIVCMDRDRQVIFLPCRHRVCCAICSETTDICPSCRVEVVEKINPFED